MPQAESLYDLLGGNAPMGNPRQAMPSSTDLSPLVPGTGPHSNAQWSFPRLPPGREPAWDAFVAGSPISENIEDRRNAIPPDAPVPMPMPRPTPGGAGLPMRAGPPPTGAGITPEEAARFAMMQPEAAPRMRVSDEELNALIEYARQQDEALRQQAQEAMFGRKRKHKGD